MKKITERRLRRRGFALLEKPAVRAFTGRSLYLVISHNTSIEISIEGKPKPARIHILDAKSFFYTDHNMENMAQVAKLVQGLGGSLLDLRDPDQHLHLEDDWPLYGFLGNYTVREVIRCFAPIVEYRATIGDVVLSATARKQLDYDLEKPRILTLQQMHIMLKAID